MKKLLLIVFILLIAVLIFQLVKENEKDTVKEAIENKHKGYIKIKSQTFVNFLYPTSTKNQIVNHIKYSFSYSEKDEQAEWVAYKLFKNSINNSIKRKNNFREDLKVKTGSSTLKDYKYSGYDRGHLAPAKTMSFNDLTMSESFYMSNMSPQDLSFNRGIWKKLEVEVRSLIAISDSLYVITGPVLKNPLGSIGESQVTIPRYYYKSIIRFNKDKLYGIGFFMKNEKSNRSVASFSVSIDSIEKVTGLDFFSHLEFEIQSEIESNTDYHFFLQK